MLWEPFKVTVPTRMSVGYLETKCRRRICPRPFIYYIQLLAMSLWTNLEAVANGAVNFNTPNVDFFCIGNGAMNALQYCLRRNELSALLETVKKCLQVHCSQYNYTTACWISFPCWQFVPELPTAVQVGAETLKGSHRMGDGRIFLKTSAALSLIRAFQMSLILCRIHLTGQYL